MKTPRVGRDSGSGITLCHADWSSNPDKRRYTCTSATEGRWRVGAAVPVGDLDEFRSRITAYEGAVVLGLDVPLGIPEAWARRVGVKRFRALLTVLKGREWSDFFEPAGHPGEISLRRPFYPAGRGAGTRRAELSSALGLASPADLRRRCDGATVGRGAGEALFWLVGPAQVGRAAVSVWRDLLLPLAGDEEGNVPKLRIWPFDGESIFGDGDAGSYAHGTDSAGTGGERPTRCSLTVAEVYPGEAAVRMGLRRRSGGTRWSKRRREDRAAHAPAILRWCAARAIDLAPAAHEDLLAGFPGNDGEDRFDSLLGVLMMIEVADGRLPHGAPDYESVRWREGWILGLDTADLVAR